MVGVGEVSGREDVAGGLVVDPVGVEPVADPPPAPGVGVVLDDPVGPDELVLGVSVVGVVLGRVDPGPEVGCSDVTTLVVDGEVVGPEVVAPGVVAPEVVGFDVVAPEVVGSGVVGLVVTISVVCGPGSIGVPASGVVGSTGLTGCSGLPSGWPLELAVVGFGEEIIAVVATLSGVEVFTEGVCGEEDPVDVSGSTTMELV